MKTITDKIKYGKILVSDGAWGTFLQQMGLKAGECPELWNLNHPGKVYDIAKSYIDAGSDMIETNSFGGNALKLKGYNLEDRAYQINKAAAQISRRAAGGEKHVLGSMGPTGKFLIMEEVSAEQMYDVFKEQAQALADGGADALVIETMTDIEEAKIAVQAASENTSCEIVATMTFEHTQDGSYKTMMGIDPAEMIRVLVDNGANIIGANCGNGVAGMIDITREIRKTNQTIPVLIHANAGMPVYKEGETVFPESPDVMAGHALNLIKQGANVIGGCCGTTPDHIRKIRELVDNL